MRIKLRCDSYECRAEWAACVHDCVSVSKVECVRMCKCDIKLDILKIGIE